jgi:hypothetical protein
MKTPRRKFSASFKAKVAIEEIKEQSILQDLSELIEQIKEELQNITNNK